MTSAVWGERHAQPEETIWMSIVPAAAFAGIVCLRLAIQFATSGALFFEDDAFYYTIIAHNIAQSGVSTFDGQTLTNGYHPLWLGILVLQDFLFGASIYVTAAIEVLLATVGVYFFLTTFRTQSLLFRILFALILAVLTRPMIAKGMEISLLICTLGFFTRCAVATWEGRGDAMVLGVATALCIGARIDCAAFVLPAMVFAVHSLRDGVRAAIPLGIGGALFAGANLAIFGTPFPISGAIKSLGGLQINWRVLNQIGLETSRPSVVASVVAFANGLIGRCIVLFGLTVVALLFGPRRTKSRPLLWGYLIGFALFAAKIVFLSSWVVWPWYTFPAVIGLVAVFHAADDFAMAERFALGARLQTAVAALLVVAAAIQVYGGARFVGPNFELINRAAVTELKPVLNGERVAMGDRAGSFAAYYPGPVTQLEGLVNDRAWLDAVRDHRDIKPLLCDRGVRFVLSYQRDLGQYDKVVVPVMRPWLTGFNGPELTFSHADEVGRVSDLDTFDSSKVGDEGDNYLYAWRLTGCPVK